MSQGNTSYKVFISCTKKDLKEYRDAVSEQLKHMNINGVTMEDFNSSDGETSLEVSLKYLESCNIFIGIIGHCYGSVPDGHTKSYVQSEYDRAVELKREGKIKEIFCYLANDEVGIQPKNLEKDPVRQKQLLFREKLLKYHKKFFNTPDDLAKKVSADLFSKINEKTLQDNNVIIFEDNDQIEYYFDYLGDERSKRVQVVMEQMVSSFNGLFTIGPKDIDNHPFLKNTRKNLLTTVPRVLFDNTDKKLERTGVPHVIMRTETALILLRAIKDGKQDLSEMGEQIGSTAARDLIENTVEAKKFVPATPDALIKLWDFWDSTGGWGSLSLRNYNPKKGTWCIRIENNFLDSRGDTNSELADFWCGYIKGFLNSALPMLSKYVTTQLSKNEQAKVTIPPFHKVDTVRYIENSESESDIFYVKFKVGKFVHAQRMMVVARDAFYDENYPLSMTNCFGALTQIKSVLSKHSDAKFEKVLDSMSEKDRSIILQILQIDENTHSVILDETIAKESIDAMYNLTEYLTGKNLQEN